jgi:hypothetical protein
VLALLFAETPSVLATREAAQQTVGISLSPAVVMLSGRPGQAHRQTLRLTNHTSRELSFTLVAQDVIAENGRRTFLDAGIRPDSVAARAIFAPAELTIPAGQVGAAEITLTVPARTDVRGIAAIFHGETSAASRSGVAMVASLGCLITFSLSDNVSLIAEPPAITPQSSTTPLIVSELVANTGSEPVVASGAMAILNDQETLVGKVAIEAQRLMPGERLPFTAEYPTALRPGRYRAVLSLEYEKKVLTSSVDVLVAPDGADGRNPARDPGRGR